MADDRIFWRRKTAPRKAGRVNVGGAERVGSLAIGAVLLGASMRRGPLGRVLLSGLGGLALIRGITGHSRVYEMAGVTSSDLAHGAGIDIDENVTINAPVAEVYRRWADLTQLPRYMRYLRSVEELRPGVTHWVVELPVGAEIEWDAELIADKPNELIAWHTLPGQMVAHSGSARFREVPGRGTELQLKLRFVPPTGSLGFMMARLGRALEQRGVAEELRRFKSIVEAGEAPTTEGQPSGRAADREKPPTIATAPVSTGGARRGDIGKG